MPGCTWKVRADSRSEALRWTRENYQLDAHRINDNSIFNFEVQLYPGRTALFANPRSINCKWDITAKNRSDAISKADRSISFGAEQISDGVYEITNYINYEDGSPYHQDGDFY